MRTRLVSLLLCLSCASVVRAQDRGVFASIGAGAARVDSITGIAVNASLVARTHRFQVVVTPIEFVSYSGGRASYITRDVAGYDVCANPARGAVGTRQSCVGSTALYGASASVGARVAETPAFIGIGTRASSAGVVTFGTITTRLGMLRTVPLSAAAQVGPRFTSVMVSVGRRMRRGRTLPG